MIHPQGTGQNVRSHLLIGTIRIDSYGGSIEWSLKCPYEGPRACGAVETCEGIPADVEKWGCMPYPPVPSLPSDLKTLAGAALGHYPEEYLRQFEVWEGARDAWQDDHDYAGGGEYGHRTELCWYEYYFHEGDMEPEDILRCFPDGTVLATPLKVLVGTIGYEDETAIEFQLWKDEADAQTV